jgi:hypothetical protein
MIRTVWLTLCCLIGLGALAAIKFGSMVLASAEVPVYEKRSPASAKAEPSETATPVDVDALPYENDDRANLQNDTLGKADKLEPAYKEESTLKKVVKSVGIVPTKNAADPLEKKTTRIASRHWHDPYDKQTGSATPPRRAKGKH